jgi:hypothetical protein
VKKITTRRIGRIGKREDQQLTVGLDVGDRLPPDQPSGKIFHGRLPLCEVIASYHH